MSFFVSSVLGRVFAVLILLAIGSVVLVITGSDGEQPKSDQQEIRKQIDGSTTDLSEAAEAINAGVQLATLRTNLKLTGRWRQYRIRRIEPVDGGYTVHTSLPPGQASIEKVDQFCEDLLGGDPPEVLAPGGLLVFGSGTEPLSGESCGQTP